MSDELEKLERTVEREMSVLGALPELAPAAGCIGRVQAAVLAEATRLARRRRWLRRIGTGAGLAAALLVAVLAPRLSARRPAAAVIDPDAALYQWSSAWDEASMQLAALAEQRWSSHSYELSDPAAELDEHVDSLAQSFEYMGDL